MPIPAALIPALIQAGVGLAGAAQKGITAANQRKLAKEYGKTKRPEYQIPPSLVKAADIARANLNPAINPQELLEVDKDVANTLSIAQKIGGTSTADMLAGAIGAQGNKYAAKRNLFANNQNRKDMAMNSYLSILGNMAGQENKAWEWEQAQPYLNAQEAAQALNQTAGQNAGNIINDLAAGIGIGANTYLTGQNQSAQNDIMKQMLGAMYGEKSAAELPSATEAPILSTNNTANPALQIGSKVSPLMKMVLKNWNTNANIPVYTQISEGKTPIQTNTATGEVVVNGKPLVESEKGVNTNKLPQKPQREREEEALSYAFKKFGGGAVGKDFNTNINNALSQYLPLIIKMMQNK